jgi:hypothetical protein
MLGGFLLGCVIAAIGVLLLNALARFLLRPDSSDKYSRYDTERTAEDVEKEAAAMLAYMKKLKVYTLAKDKLARVTDITNQQMDLLKAVDQPSINASHSRYKNSIAQLLRDLEKEKILLFRDILDLGIDPILTVYTQEGIVHTRMSQIVESHPMHMGTATNTEPTNTRNRPMLKLIKSVGDDHAAEPDDPQVH